MVWIKISWNNLFPNFRKNFHKCLLYKLFAFLDVVLMFCSRKIFYSLKALKFTLHRISLAIIDKNACSVNRTYCLNYHCLQIIVLPFIRYLVTNFSRKKFQNFFNPMYPNCNILMHFKTNFHYCCFNTILTAGIRWK